MNSGSPVHYIKTQCFTFPLTGTLLGDAGRNILTGPGQTNLDFAVVKNMRVHKISDTSRAQFRAELFNALNHANFMPPLDNLKLFDAKGQPIASAGLLTATATTARQIQFALKLIW